MIKFRIDMKAIKTNIAKMKKEVPSKLERALYIETEIEATEAKKRTPVDITKNAPHPGRLRSTVHATRPQREGLRLFTQIVAGGDLAPYAIYVHENLTAFHPIGQAKFIESVIEESRPYMAARIAKRVGKLV